MKLCRRQLASRAWEATMRKSGLLLTGNRHARRLLAAASFAAFIAAPPAADAKVTKFAVVRVEPAFAGRSFGTTGSYEKITALATIGVDPADRHNSIVVDLDRAPRNAAGLVEAVSEVVILRPVDPAKANHRLLYE